jgi:hypothetical protein
MTSTSTDFRVRGLWQWNPVSCVGPRGYDERYMQAHSDWFFDRDLMCRYFDGLVRAGLNTWVLANTHPFPFMVDLAEYPDAVVLSPEDLARYQAHYRWLFAAAAERGLAPFVLFHTCYVPDPFGIKHDIRPLHSYEPPALAYDYTRHCVRQLCDTYPELAGIYAEASENVRVDLRARFANKAIISGIHQSAQRPRLMFRGWISEPAEMKELVLDAYEGECVFGVKYTWEHLVHRRPDPEFMRWVDTCGAANVAAEFWISNCQPFGCHDLELAAGLRDELQALGCAGFTSHPMDMYGAPFVQGTDQRCLQIDRDRTWFRTLAGDCVDGVAAESDRFGLALAPGSLRAASRPAVRASWFMTWNKQNFLEPQLLAFVAQTERKAEVQHLDAWLKLPAITEASYGRWPEQLDGIASRYPGEDEGDFDLAALVAGLEALDADWEDVPETAPAEPEVYAAWRAEVRAQHLLAGAWRERAHAVLAHHDGDRAGVPTFLERSLALVRKVPETVGFDGPYRLLIGRHTFIIRWSEMIAALEQELADYPGGTLAEHYTFGAAEFYDTPDATVTVRDFA